MSALQLLRDDHKTVLELFRRYEDSVPGGDGLKASITQKIAQELSVHSELEERIFYPAFQKAAHERGDVRALAFVIDFQDTHAEIDRLVRDVRSIGANAADFELTSLILDVRGHIEEEEKDMFPLAESLLADADEELGREMERMKNELLSQEHRRGAA